MLVCVFVVGFSWSALAFGQSSEVDHCVFPSPPVSSTNFDYPSTTLGMSAATLQDTDSASVSEQPYSLSPEQEGSLSLEAATPTAMTEVGQRVREGHSQIAAALLVFATVTMNTASEQAASGSAEDEIDPDELSAGVVCDAEQSSCASIETLSSQDFVEAINVSFSGLANVASNDLEGEPVKEENPRAPMCTPGDPGCDNDFNPSGSFVSIDASVFFWVAQHETEYEPPEPVLYKMSARREARSWETVAVHARLHIGRVERPPRRATA